MLCSDVNCSLGSSRSLAILGKWNSEPLFLLLIVVEELGLYEFRQRSKKQQKVPQNHEHIIGTQKDDVKGDAEIDRRHLRKPD